jgi:glycerol-3-phosphate cytidylyltransferase
MKRYKIGYTTGVFDLFHIGHVNILRQAKELCDYLIVGVSTDELVHSYKNKSPIVPYEERKAILEAIKYVDEVIPQTSLSKCDALECLEFNVMFHGDDWKNSPLFLDAEREFKKKGVDMIFFPYTKGTSSSLLKETLQEVLK